MVVVWIVAVINAYNLIDGLDGLASGLAIISATGLCGILFLGNLPGVVLPLVALMGACLAFLRYNFHPATIFLGDTGSMFIGLILGVVSLQTFTKDTFFLSMAIPLLMLGVPDLRRPAGHLAKVRAAFGQGPRTGGAGKRSGIMSADLEHLHHRLVKAGLSTRRVAMVLCVHERGVHCVWPVDDDLPIPCLRHFPAGLAGGAYVLLRHMAVIELRETGRRPVDRFAPSDSFPAQSAGLSVLGHVLPGRGAGDCHAGVCVCPARDSGIRGSWIFRFG